MSKKEDFVMTAERQSEVVEIHSKFHDQITTQVGYVIRNQFDAEDIIQAVYIKIARFLDTFKSDLSALPTWVYNVTDSVIKDWFRTNHSEHYQQVSAFVDEDGNPTFNFTTPDRADSMVENDELKQRMLKAFRELKPKYRKIAVMYFVRELEYLEISEELNVPLGTVKGMISRCREMLKTELNDLYKVKKKKELA